MNIIKLLNTVFITTIISVLALVVLIFCFPIATCVELMGIVGKIKNGGMDTIERNVFYDITETIVGFVEDNVTVMMK